MKKYLWTMLILVAILALVTVNAAAQRGGKGGGGGGGGKPDDGTGELYGDLYVVLRDQSGEPVLDDHGCIQPIANSDPTIFPEGSATTVISTDDDPLTVTAYAGEPFELPYYTLDGDVVACELTEEMSQWVQTVDFGRLNLGRAPDMVIDHAFDEAINKFNQACAMDLDPAGRIMLEVEEVCGDEFELWLTIDSPAENLAMYIEMMTEGNWIIPDETPTSRKGGDPAADDVYRPVLSEDAIAMIENFEAGIFSNLVDDGSTTANLDSDDYLLAASLLAAAGDKFGDFTLDKIVYINSIYGINPTNGVFNFGQFMYAGSGNIYGQLRGSRDCTADGDAYVLVPITIDGSEYWQADCVSILDVVEFTHFTEEYTRPDGVVNYLYDADVRGFTQAASDSVQVLEYIHNYSVPEDIYAGD